MDTSAYIPPHANAYVHTHTSICFHVLITRSAPLPPSTPVTLSGSNTPAGKKPCGGAGGCEPTATW